MAMLDLSWTFERSRRATIRTGFVAQAELAELLSLPPGLHGQTCSLDALPRTSGDARVLHTQLSRSLGKIYRDRWSLSLRADRTGVELMQRILHVRFPTAVVRTQGDAAEVFMHAAFFSEICARQLGCAWSDIDSPEVSRWCMTAPDGGDVSPFARVIAFVMGGGGPDLVGAYDALD